MAHRKLQHDDELVLIGRPRFRWSWTLDGSLLATFAVLGGLPAVLLSLPRAVAHLFNHQTHHRGQITTLFTQAMP